LTKPYLYHTLVTHNQKVGEHLSTILFPFPFCEIWQIPTQHLLLPFCCPCQKQESLSNTKPPIIWYP
ncbi:unnamed protein product, partial [Musa acuminata var. zebrina]